MRSLTHIKLLGAALAAVTVAGIASGCRSHDETAYYPTYSEPAAVGGADTTTTYQSGWAADNTTDISQRRVDETDTGPGTPKGDAQSADPSETSSQGAGSRALVGDQGAETEAVGGATITTEEDSRVMRGPPITEPDTTPATTQETKSVVIPLHKEQVQVQKREVENGTVTLRKTVKTETVNQPVELRTETVTIDRRPAEAVGGTADESGTSSLQSSAQGQPFQQQEYTIKLKREEAQVQKEVVPAGQIVAETQVQTKQTNVQTQVRTEDISIDKGGSQNVRLSQNLQSSATQESAVGGSSQAGETTTSGAAAGSGQAITDVSMLNPSQDLSSMAGRPVRLSEAKVKAVISPRLISIDANSDLPLYVRLQQPVEGLKEGSTVNLSGTVRQASTAAQELGGEAAHVLSQQKVFIDAQSAQIARSGQR
ncbi:MAG TPA: YsnF/AvaK domain-containing protein [Clostridia bacterium]|nr:YsnF/AvaK domain-containing protein [Clostridia bacterium]